ncbi:hypothetical protein TSUD_219500 [Trifolium subterraneum]|uniref:Uncharacterized protein n=1 Tax=Trifolium subterraneum TaxID=3900 RepID=A0A2Z6NU02_TRISU|nr:hypothetical protein TSUD_219500 [Trifolium subterraneum]
MLVSCLWLPLSYVVLYIDRLKMENFQNYRDVDVHSSATDSSDASSESDEYYGSENIEDEDGNDTVSAADQSSDD